MATIEERLKKILKDQLDIEDKKLVSHARLTQAFHADTTDLVHIAWAIAEEFHLNFADIDMSQLLTIGDLLDYINEHVKEGER